MGRRGHDPVLARRTIDLLESGKSVKEVAEPRRRAVCATRGSLTSLAKSTLMLVAFAEAVRVHAELTKGLGIKVSHGTVALLMRRANIQGATGGRKPHYLPPQTTAKDLVDPEFSRDLPNQLWVTDATEHPTREGKPLLLCRARGLFEDGSGLGDRLQC